MSRCWGVGAGEEVECRGGGGVQGDRWREEAGGRRVMSGRWDCRPHTHYPIHQHPARPRAISDLLIVGIILIYTRFYISY